MMIFWTCGGITLLAALVAAFVSNIRRSILALWVCGLGAGGIFLSLGAEVLAVVQWILSTVVTISFLFYAVMFGEFEITATRPLPQRILISVLPILLGLGFIGMIWIGSKDLTALRSLEPTIQTSGGQDIGALGGLLVEKHILSLEILGVMLLLVIVGSGVIARPDGGTQE